MNVHPSFLSACVVVDPLIGCCLPSKSYGSNGASSIFIF